ncbi:MAG: hypothetical protein IJY69_01670 [Clostridia bacterium]|nr:hypothetical protein [Clostridia bacterium]
MKKSKFKLWLMTGLVLLLSFSLWSCFGSNDEPFELDPTNIDSVLNFWNNSSDPLSEAFLSSDIEGGASSADALSDFSISVDGISYSGDEDMSVNKLIFHDKTLYMSADVKGEDGEVTPTTTVTKIYDNGSVTLTTVDGKTTALLTGLESGDSQSLDSLSVDMKKLNKILALDENDISLTDEPLVYELNRSYLEKVAAVLRLTDNDLEPFDMTLDKFADQYVTFDFSDYADAGLFVFKAYDHALNNIITIRADLTRYGYRTGGISVSAAFPGVDLTISADWENDVIYAMDARIILKQIDSTLDIDYDLDRSYKPLKANTPAEDCDSETLNLKLTKKKEEQFVLALKMSQLKKETVAGTFELTLASSALEDAVDSSSSLVPSIPNIPDEVKVKGGFRAVQDDGELVAFDTEMTAEAEDDTEIYVSLSLNLENMKKVGGTVCSLTVNYSAPDPESDSGEMKEDYLHANLTTQSCINDCSEFALSLVISDEGEEETLTAAVNVPAKEEMPLTSTEEVYLGRAGTYFYKIDEVEAKINTTNEKAKKFVWNEWKQSSPRKYYWYDSVTRQYYFTEIVLKGSTVYIRTGVIIDYENYVDKYHRHDGDFYGYRYKPGL